MKKIKCFSVLLFFCSFVALAGCEGTEPEPQPSPDGFGVASEPECVQASDCGASYPDCYAWACAEGECVYETDDDKCPEGYFCKILVGCALEYPDSSEPDCETNDDCLSFDCVVGECRNGRCFSELRNEFCFPGWKCTTFGCVRDDDYYDNRCYSDAECDDGIGCTRDMCVLNSHACVNAPMNSRCPGDLVCTPTGCVDVF